MYRHSVPSAPRFPSCLSNCPTRTVRSLMILMTGAVLATACGGSDNPTEVQTDMLTIEAFVGSWRATSEVFTNNANAGETFDLLAAGGENRFTMLTGGGTRIWFDLGDFHDEWDSQLTLNSPTMLTSDPVEASRPVEEFTFVLSGNTLTLTNINAVFDFTLTGALGVPATMVAVFTKSG